MDTQQPARAAEADRKPARLHELDGLRAVAISLVVLHHSVTGPVTEALTNRGFGRLADLLFFTTGSGVELFFVLSGIVLLRPYLRQERRFRALTFLRRRLERLWPPYAVALVFAALIVYVVGLHPTWYSSVLPEFSGPGWLAQTGIVNLGWDSYNGAWWSLNLEVIFYILVPLLVIALVAGRPRSTRVAIFIGLAVAASLVVASISEVADVYLRVAAMRDAVATADFWAVVQAFLIYGPCFAMGVAIARFDFPARLGMVLVAYGAFHCVTALWNPWVNVHLGYALVYAGLAIVAIEGCGRLRASLSKPLAIWLGERSYSLFLVHFSVFYLASYVASLLVPNRGAGYFLMTRLAGIPLALLAAMVLFTGVERRFAHGLSTADRFWPWRISTDTDEHSGPRTS